MTCSSDRMVDSLLNILDLLLVLHFSTHCLFGHLVESARDIGQRLETPSDHSSHHSLHSRADSLHKFFGALLDAFIGFSRQFDEATADFIKETDRVSNHS